jgi:hypothetical protein
MLLPSVKRGLQDKFSQNQPSALKVINLAQVSQVDIDTEKM